MKFDDNIPLSNLLNDIRQSALEPGIEFNDTAAIRGRGLGRHHHAGSDDAAGAE
ncbi:hypothetical protein [Burkholderia sp. Ac-20353]|uniref:hypothetical protein n=1 Tax=Burkholderia sp. Ac-20353 TaxID=2703894 RepID=UPI003216F525